MTTITITCPTCSKKISIEISTIDQLKKENAALRAEVERLKGIIYNGSKDNSSFDFGELLRGFAKK